MADSGPHRLAILAGALVFIAGEAGLFAFACMTRRWPRVRAGVLTLAAVMLLTLAAGLTWWWMGSP